MSVIVLHGVVGHRLAAAEAQSASFICDSGAISCPCIDNFLNKTARIPLLTGRESIYRQWRFMLGDVVFFEKPWDLNRKFLAAHVISAVSISAFIHDAMVVELPPDNETQTADNVILAAVTAAANAVEIISLRKALSYFQFSGIAVERVDQQRFRFFKDKIGGIVKWTKGRVGEPYNLRIAIPMWKVFDPDHVLQAPGCKTRKRVREWFETTGGPHHWMCSQFIAWALAFPGGLNTDYWSAGDEPPWIDYGFVTTNVIEYEPCGEPVWYITDLQPLPGRFRKMDFFDSRSSIHLKCRHERFRVASRSRARQCDCADYCDDPTLCCNCPWD